MYVPHAPASIPATLAEFSENDGWNLLDRIAAAKRVAEDQDRHEDFILLDDMATLLRNENLVADA